MFTNVIGYGATKGVTGLTQFAGHLTHGPQSWTVRGMHSEAYSPAVTVYGRTV